MCNRAEFIGGAPTRTARSRRGALSLLLASAAGIVRVGTFAIGTVAIGTVGLAGPAGAQTTTTLGVPLQPITVTVNFVKAVPSGVSGYRVDTTCKNVPGAAADGNVRLAISFGAAGGTGQVLVPLNAAVSCAFRLLVLGTGNRPLIGTQVFVGGVGRFVTYPTTVDGTAIDPSTVVETDFIPVTAPTSVLFGEAPAASTTTTAPASTTIGAAATTTPSPTSTPAPTTKPVQPSTPAPTTKPASGSTAAPTTRQTAARTKLIRVCTRHRNHRCVASKLVRVRV